MCSFPSGWLRVGRGWRGSLGSAWWVACGTDGGERAASPSGLELGDQVPAAAEVDDLWARTRDDSRNGLIRDGAWIRWRYLEAPDAHYRVLTARRSGRLEGLLWYRVRAESGRTVAFVAEILSPADRGDAQEALLREVVARARSEGVELVAALVLDRSSRELLLRRNGFLRSWGAFTVGCVSPPGRFGTGRPEGPGGVVAGGRSLRCGLSPRAERPRTASREGWASLGEIAFALRGWVGPQRAQPWGSPGAQSVIVVAPHPDDEVAGCGGTILLHRACGDSVTVVHATDGRQSRALGLGADEMAIRRRMEAEGAARVMDAEVVWIGLPEGDWAEDDLSARLRTLLEEAAPHVVYAPSRVDFHPEHRKVATSLARALAGGAGHPLVRTYQVQVPLTASLTNVVASTGSVARRARSALEAYQTQVGSLRRTLRMKRYAGLRHRATPEAEVFWELPVPAYAALHHGCQDEVATAAFRGVPSAADE